MLSPRMAASMSSTTVDSETMVSGTTLTTGIPLLEAADMASSKKYLKANVTVGVFFPSTKIESYTRYLVQAPQSPTAATTASTPFIQSSNLDRLSGSSEETENDRALNQLVSIEEGSPRGFIYGLDGIKFSDKYRGCLRYAFSQR